MIRKLVDFCAAFVYAMSVLAEQEDDDWLTDVEYLEECYKLDSKERNWR